ncbi:MAG TPA: hypothetical protein VHS96_03090 [Bacteroidia bacterium]|nr:hypothetical protein [Bacteroidia bacterium]
MKRFSWIRFVIAAICWICATNAVWSQSEPESAKASLQLQSLKDTIVIPLGSSISVNYRHDPKTYRKQVLEAVLDSAVVLAGDTVEVKYIDRIGVVREDMHEAGKVTLWVSLISIVGFYLAVILLIVLPSSSILFFLAVITAILFGIPATLAFPAGVIVGVILLLKSEKYYPIGYKWRLRTRKAQPKLPKR